VQFAVRLKKILSTQGQERKRSRWENIGGFLRYFFPFGSVKANTRLVLDPFLERIDFGGDLV
jgi:hypothetical protein